VSDDWAVPKNSTRGLDGIESGQLTGPNRAKGRNLAERLNEQCARRAPTLIWPGQADAFAANLGHKIGNAGCEANLAEHHKAGGQFHYTPGTKVEIRVVPRLSSRLFWSRKPCWIFSWLRFRAGEGFDVKVG